MAKVGREPSRSRRGVLPSELLRVNQPRISSWFSSAVLLKSSDGNTISSTASSAHNRLRPTTLAEKSISPKSSTDVGKDER